MIFISVQKKQKLFIKMVSYYNPMSMAMYQKGHGNNLPYGHHSWYASNYPPPASHHGSNGQYLSGAGNTNTETDSMYFNSHHHHMFHQSSPDWVGHDNYGQQSQNSPILPTTLVQTSTNGTDTPINGPSTPNHGPSSNGIDSHMDQLGDDRMHVPPSPPITVNSGCSDMSSPGIGNSTNGMNANDDTANHLSLRPVSSKSPYEWMKKPSYQSQPQPGLFA